MFHPLSAQTTGYLSGFPLLAHDVGEGGRERDPEDVNVPSTSSPLGALRSNGPHSIQLLRWDNQGSRSGPETVHCLPMA